jgi:hypothetical protein
VVSGPAGRVVKLTTRVHLELGLRKSGGMSPLPHMLYNVHRDNFTLLCFMYLGSDILQAYTVEIWTMLG